MEAGRQEIIRQFQDLLKKQAQELLGSFQSSQPPSHQFLGDFSFG